MKLSEIIREYRLKSQESLDVLAKRSGLSKAYISMLEKDKKSSSGKPIKPTLDTLEKLAKGMHMPLDSLLISIGDSPRNLPLKKDQYKGTPVNFGDLYYYLDDLQWQLGGKRITNFRGIPLDQQTLELLDAEISHLKKLAGILAKNQKRH